jgi:hypothetical protein
VGSLAKVPAAIRVARDFQQPASLRWLARTHQSYNVSKGPFHGDELIVAATRDSSRNAPILAFSNALILTIPRDSIRREQATGHAAQANVVQLHHEIRSRFACASRSRRQEDRRLRAVPLPAPMPSGLLPSGQSSAIPQLFQICLDRVTH